MKILITHCRIYWTSRFSLCLKQLQRRIFMCLLIRSIEWTNIIIRCMTLFTKLHSVFCFVYKVCNQIREGLRHIKIKPHINFSVSNFCSENNLTLKRRMRPSQLYASLNQSQHRTIECCHSFYFSTQRFIWKVQKFFRIIFQFLCCRQC